MLLKLSIMLLKLPIMLFSNAAEFCLLCSNYAPQLIIKLHKFTIFFLLSYLHYKIMSISRLSTINNGDPAWENRAYVHKVYSFTLFHLSHLCCKLYIQVIPFVTFATLVSTYSTKPLPQIQPNLLKYVFYIYFIDYTDNFCLLCCHYTQCFCHPIMLKIMLAYNRLEPVHGEKIWRSQELNPEQPAF